MSDVIKVNTARLATDSDKILKCIESIGSRTGAIEAELLKMGSGIDDPDIAEVAEAFRKSVRDLQFYMEELGRIHVYETEARSKYERCVNHVDSVIEGISI